MLNEVFSDYFAQKENFLTKIDPRIKMIFVFGAIIITISSPTSYVPIIITLLGMAFLLSVGLPPKIILLRLIAPLGIAMVVLATQIFFYGKIPIFKWNLFGFNLVGYKEGLLHGFLIMGKIIGAVSLVIFLSLTTPVNKLLSAARWFKMPRIWIEVAMLTYRYVFVLLADALTIKDAQKVRLGYSSLSKSLKSLGELAGSVVIRAYDQSIATYEAMMLRGYNGTMRNIAYKEAFKVKDMMASFIFVTILALLLAVNILNDPR